MNNRQESRIKKLGIFTLEQATEIGLSQQSLSRLVAAKGLTRVERGIYLPYSNSTASKSRRGSFRFG